jgi:tetratricopeptide (TPR) repeat protein
MIVKARRLLSLALVSAIAAGAATRLVARSAPSAQSGPQAGTLDLLFDQGKRLFDAFQYEEAAQLFDRLINAMAVTGQTQRPDLLVQAYEMRARSRFSLGDSAAAERDFSALLAIKPDFRLAAGVSPRVVAVFEGVRKITVGQIALSMNPPGDLQIDGRAYTASPTPNMVDMTAGDHQVSVLRPGFRPVTQKVTVTAGAVSPLALTLERVSANLEVVSIPEGVEVLLDGKSLGTTPKGTDANGVSAPLMLSDLPLGAHKLELKRDCYVGIERTITLAAADLRTEPLRLTPSTALVSIQSSQPTAAVFVDGAARGQAPTDVTVCAGSHLIEVRGAKGRFIDRRDWKTGDNATLTADLRSAFPIVVTKASTDAPAPQLRTNVERALAPAKRVMVYAPADAELQAALRDETVPSDWLVAPASETGASVAGLPREVTRELGRRLATKLGAQGVAAISAGPEPYSVRIALLAAGSAEPDVITINTADPASQARAAELLGGALPPIMRPSIETAVVDVAGTPGAVVVRAGGAGAKAGLTPGDTIVAAGGRPVASVADLRARIAAIATAPSDLALDVKNLSGVTRKVTVTVAMLADTIPMRDPSVLYNRALLDLSEAIASAPNAAAGSAARLNLAIVDMRLGNWDDALNALKDVQLPDGPGVSAGTIAYLVGLCQEATGRTAEAQASFAKAAAATQSRLWSDGPLVAPLAQAKGRR